MNEILNELRIRDASREYFVPIEIINGVDVFPVSFIRREATRYAYLCKVD
jgi:hypothetical protein